MIPMSHHPDVLPLDLRLLYMIRDPKTSPSPEPKPQVLHDQALALNPAFPKPGSVTP